MDRLIIGIVITFGAYHHYIINQKWKLQQEIHRLQDEKTKAMLEEMREKRKWWRFN